MTGISKQSSGSIFPRKEFPRTNEEFLFNTERRPKDSRKKILPYIDISLMCRVEDLDESDIKRAFSETLEIGRCTKLDQKSLGNMRKLPFEKAVEFCRNEIRERDQLSAGRYAFVRMLAFLLYSKEKGLRENPKVFSTGKIRGAGRLGYHKEPTDADHEKLLRDEGIEELLFLRKEFLK